MTHSSTSFAQGLDVRVYGVRVGRLARDPHGGIRFTPDRQWLDDNQRPPLGLAFLSNPAPRIQRGSIPVWFENLLPEPETAMRRRICAQHDIRDRDSATLLQVLGGDLPGAVEIGGDINQRDDDTTAAVDDGKLRFSLAGMQLKLSMLLTEDRFVLPARGQSGQWIVKIPGGEFSELPEVEATTMAWAAAAGLETPHNYVLPMEALEGVDPALLERPRHAFAVKRFDRQAAGRVHQEDFAQALEIRPSDKYGERTRAPTYDSLSRLVRDACGQPAQDEFIRRLAFVVASGNDDAHLKNWSFQWAHEHRPRLSPCYDQVATIAWAHQFGWSSGRGPTLALSFAKTRRFSDLNRQRLQQFAERARAPHAEKVFMNMLERVHGAWREIIDQAPKRMRAALIEHWRRVPLLREFGDLPTS
ncbi:MAG: HipA domain-containing protein [Haliangiales bacterium]